MENHGDIPTRNCTLCGLISTELTKFVKDKGSKHGFRNRCTECEQKRKDSHPNMKDWKTDHQTKKRYGGRRYDIQTTYDYQ